MSLNNLVYTINLITFHSCLFPIFPRFEGPRKTFLILYGLLKRFAEGRSHHILKIFFPKDRPARLLYSEKSIYIFFKYYNILSQH